MMPNNDLVDESFPISDDLCMNMSIFIDDVSQKIGDIILYFEI